MAEQSALGHIALRTDKSALVWAGLVPLPLT
jgi:hypothetical protein